MIPEKLFLDVNALCSHIPGFISIEHVIIKVIEIQGV